MGKEKLKEQTNFNTQKLKNNKAITLIALVVTIVVLLILAGISISLVAGDNGLIKKARDARDETRYASIKEEVELWKADKSLAETTGGNRESLNDFITRLKLKDNEQENVEKDASGKIKKITIKIGDKTIDLSDSKTLVQAFKDGEIKVGDYLNYNTKVDTSKSYKSETNQNGWADQTYTATQETSWRVLGLNESEDQLILISANPIAKNMKTTTTDPEVSNIKNKYMLASLNREIKLAAREPSVEPSVEPSTVEKWETDPYLYMKGAYGYVNCVKMLDGISGIYNTSLGTAKSLTAKEINRLLGVTVDKENKKVYVNTAPDTNIDEWGVLGNTYTYKSTDYTPESYINNKTNVDTSKIPSVTADAYYYSWENLTIDATLREMLFSKTTSSDKFSKSYWLASPGVCANGSYARFGPGSVINGGVREGGYSLFYSDGRWSAYRLGVRPVVYLNSEVSVDDLQKTEAGTDTWNYDNSKANVASGTKDNGEAGNLMEKK